MKEPRSSSSARHTSNTTDFGVTALADAARRTIAQHEMLVLSGRDRQAFFDALINPPEPGERFIRAFTEHKRRVVP